MISIDNSSNNILSCTKGCQLSKNLLGVVFEYCDINTSFILVDVNNRFRSIVKKMPIFSYFIEERKIFSQIKKDRSIFHDYPEADEESTFYIRDLRKSLLEEKKLSLSSANDFLTEIVKNILRELTSENGHINLTNYILAENPANMKIFCEALKVDNRIKCIKFTLNELGHYIESFKNLCETLKENQKITEINFSDNYLGEKEEIMEILVDLLKTNKTITSLNLDYNWLGSYGNMQMLWDALKDNNTLTSLYLSDNLLANEMTILTDILSEDKTITCLDLSLNMIGCADEEEFEDFCLGLELNNTITWIDLSFNKFGSTSDYPIKEYLLYALIGNNTLTTIELGEEYSYELGHSQKISDVDYFKSLSLIRGNLKIIEK